MKKFIFRLSIFILLIFNLTLLIIPTSARYISLDFGYAWNVLFSKYSVTAINRFFWLARHCEAVARFRADCKAGMRILARIAMMAITTRSSIKVNFISLAKRERDVFFAFQIALNIKCY